MLQADTCCQERAKDLLVLCRFYGAKKRLDRKGKLEARCEVIQMTMTSVRLEVLPENNKRQQNTSVISF